jgi:adenine C2-methylase RlmN of 23S rRNA A2503 and tRNA A37
MAWYHVGGCGCPMGCCDCGVPKYKHPSKMNKDELVKRVLELEEAEKTRKAEASIIARKETELKDDLIIQAVDEANESAKEVWKAHMRRIKAQLKKIKQLEKEARKVLDKNLAARVLFLCNELESYTDFKKYTRYSDWRK